MYSVVCSDAAQAFYSGCEGGERCSRLEAGNGCALTWADAYDERRTAVRLPSVARSPPRASPLPPPRRLSPRHRPAAVELLPLGRRRRRGLQARAQEPGWALPQARHQSPAGFPSWLLEHSRYLPRTACEAGSAATLGPARCAPLWRPTSCRHPLRLCRPDHVPHWSVASLWHTA